MVFFITTTSLNLLRQDWFGMNGTCLDINLDLPEGTLITYFACNFEGQTQLDCGPHLTESA